MHLVIVESPAKAKKIAGFLGDGWRVEACLGHVRDLPPDRLGIAVDDDFRAQYAVLSGKKRVIERLTRALNQAETVTVATDPDREGEAIAWHLLQVLRIPRDKPVYRATFHAITRDAVREAVAHPRALDTHLVQAQHTRRVIDRLVGYLASPLAAKALDGKYSAGRVQSVCLRLVVEREREIAAFQAETSWTLAVKLGVEGVDFTAKLHRVKGADGVFKTRDTADKLMAFLADAVWWIEKVGRAERLRAPLPPFTTASLQQVAAKGLGLSPDRTMALAQTLYEAGLITYMRTDSVSVAPEAQAAARDYIAGEHGAGYLPPEPPIYITKASNAQEAHEAIRPTDAKRLPQGVEGDGAALYALIWRRFIASQMSAARYTVTGAVIHAGKVQGQPFPLEFRAQGRTLTFDGWLKVYQEPPDDDDEEEPSQALPPLSARQQLTNAGLEVITHTTRAPARYSEAALVQALETRGIGRPSTYAGTIKTLKDKGYVKVSQKRLVPTENGGALCDFLTAHFADVLAEDYTARLESQLDRITAGDTRALDVLRAFWTDFQPQLQRAAAASAPTPKPLTLRPLEVSDDARP